MNRTIFGKNAAYEILKNTERQIRKVVIAKELKSELSEIIDLAKEKAIQLHYMPRKEMDRLSKGTAHQGVIVNTFTKDYVEIEDLLDKAKERDEKPLIIILDSVQDPHNLGAVLRTADGAGAHGVIILKQNAVHVTSTVERISTGASEYVPVARVSNLNYAIDILKKAGVWVVGIENEGKDEYFKVDFKMPIALIFGSEGEGIKKSSKEKCDYLVKIPMMGTITSLNVSVSAGIIMYEVLRQRLAKGGIYEK